MQTTIKGKLQAARRRFRLSQRTWRLTLFLLLLAACYIAATLCLYPLYARPLPLWMAWNLFLSLLPLVFSLLIRPRAAAAAGRTVTALLGMAWLFFFPNAPYMLTDFIHVGQLSFYIPGGFSDDVGQWLLLLHMTVGIVLGCICGMLSLRLLHGPVRRRFGSRAGVLFACAACLLCGVGVCIGRFWRLNSWDLLLRPILLLELLATKLTAEFAALSLLFALVTLLFYALFSLCMGEDGA